MYSFCETRHFTTQELRGQKKHHGPSSKIHFRLTLSIADRSVRSALRRIHFSRSAARRLAACRRARSGRDRDESLRSELLSRAAAASARARASRSEEHTSELQSQFHLVCRLLLE